MMDSLALPFSVSSFHPLVCACAKIAGWASVGIPGGGGGEFLLQEQEMSQALDTDRGRAELAPAEMAGAKW